MKPHILFLLLLPFSAAFSETSIKGPLTQTLPQVSAQAEDHKLPNSSPSAKQIYDDDKDAQVVAESMGTMVQALATFSQDPHNPIVAGTCALQALGAFIKMIIQIFDDFAPTRNLRTEQEIEAWFASLPKEKQMLIMKLMALYVKQGDSYE